MFQSTILPCFRSINLAEVDEVLERTKKEEEDQFFCAIDRISALIPLQKVKELNLTSAEQSLLQKYKVPPVLSKDVRRRSSRCSKRGRRR